MTIRIRSTPLPCGICGAELQPIRPQSLTPKRLKTGVRAPDRIVEDGRLLYAQGQFMLDEDARRLGITDDGQIGVAQDMPARRRDNGAA